MNKLKKALFLKTYKLYRQYLRWSDDLYHDELEVISTKVQFQTLYRFLEENGLEEEYLAWREEMEEEE